MFQNSTAEDVLGLTSAQLVTLVSYIVEEASRQSTELPNSSNQTTNVILNTPHSIRNRMDLLKSCLAGSEDKLCELVKHVQKLVKSQK